MKTFFFFRLVAHSPTRSAGGQILIPALFIFPSLILFAILIVEVAKLSQQKVLMQFAMDTSVFMEASQASDMANRLAYLNSPWPTRVFQDAQGEFINFPIGGSIPDKANVAEIFFRNGVYPGSTERPDPVPPVPADPWQGRFRPRVPRKNDSASPDADLIHQRRDLNTQRPPEDLGTLIPFTYEDVDQLNYPPRQDAFTWYQRIFEIYAYINQLGTMVKLVYERLHAVFFAKTFWLNTGFSPNTALVPPIMRIQEHKTTRVKLWYTVRGTFGTPIPTYNEDEIKAGATSGMRQLSTVEELAQENPSHLFNFGRYYYTGPPNHFGVAYRDLFNWYDPYVTASAEVSGGRIWPDSKPTFQVRLRP